MLGNSSSLFSSSTTSPQLDAFLKAFRKPRSRLLSAENFTASPAPASRYRFHLNLSSSLNNTRTHFSSIASEEREEFFLLSWFGKSPASDSHNISKRLIESLRLEADSSVSSACFPLSAFALKNEKSLSSSSSAQVESQTLFIVP